MTSRNRLRILLGLVSLPLVLEATTGCEIVFPLEAPLSHNALRCACECNGAGSRAAQILASADDAEQDGATVDLTSSDLDLGEKIVGIRFANAGIPRGATIESAYVQFTAGAANIASASFTIAAEASASAAPFLAVDNDVSGRTVGLATPVAWSPPNWSGGDAGVAQQTPELRTLLQELVDLPDWSDASAVVLRIEGTGHRTAESFDGDPARVAVLVVSYDATVRATVPVCASPDVVTGTGGAITSASLVAECSRVEETFEGLAEACGYPTPCDCDPVDVPDHVDSFQSEVCYEPCTETAVDATCSNFDPNAFADCLAETASVDDCKDHVAATNVAGDLPVCVASGSPFAFHLFGHRSQCDLAGTSEIHVGDREPKHDPATAGTLELLGGPCQSGGCSVHPYIDLRMAPITFAVKFHSDPTFVDLSAAGRGLETAVVDGAGHAIFPADAISGTGSGRRSSDGLAVTSTNASPLDVGVDWGARTCSMNGNLAAAVDGEVPDGVCDGDDATPCTADSPDCDDVGGPCVFETEDTEEMTVDVTLSGTLVNQPPTAAAGPDQTVECTSPAGASFTLDGRGSGDPDQNLVLTSWRQGSRIGPEVSNGLTAAQSLGVGMTEHYVLRVIDGFAQADEDETQVAVVDTTPPELSLAVSPTVLGPPNHKLVTITASITTSDICDASPAIRLVSIVSNEPDDGLGDGDTPQDVQGAALDSDDRTFQLRAERSGTGSGRVYTITYEARDDSGNTTVRQATVTVPH